MAVMGDGMIAKPADAPQAIASGAATGMSYQVDRDQIPEVITKFQRALLHLEEAAGKAQRMDRIVPPGGNPYSQQAVQTMGPELVSNYLGSNHRDKANIEAMIENLDAAMRRYDVNEDEAARRFRPEA